MFWDQAFDYQFAIELSEYNKQLYLACYREEQQLQTSHQLQENHSGI